MAKKKQNEEAEEMNIQHRVLIEEEGIDISDLPDEIKEEMRSFNSKLSEYEESGDIDLYYEIEQDDIRIADNIQNWYEDNKHTDDDDEEDYDPDDDEETEEEESEEEESEENEEKQQQQNNNLAQNNQNTQNSTSQQNAANNQVDLEAKIRESMKDGAIEMSVLKSIIGREPNYPQEKIGNLKLRKLYLKTTYVIV